MNLTATLQHFENAGPGLFEFDSQSKIKSRTHLSDVQHAAPGKPVQLTDMPLTSG